MQSHHLMPSVAADTINEAFFEETGDSILACDGQTLTLVEDYREDILKILGGKTDEADNRKVPKRIAQTVLNSLKGGVVPRIACLISPSEEKTRLKRCCMMWILLRRAALLSALL